MKRIVLALMAVLSFTQIAFAYDFYILTTSGQRLYYNITGSNNVTVTCPSTVGWDGGYNYYKPTGVLNIPETVVYNGTTYNVTSIGSYAFYYCTGLTSVSIPSGVTSIGSNAFDHCSGMSSIYIPTTVTTISSYAFSNCSGLTNINLPNSIISMEACCFYGCTSLNSINIPNTLTTIPQGAFMDCGFTSIAIPSSVNSIGTYAFAGSSLTSITIPSTISTIGVNPFAGCNNLTSIIVSTSNSNYDSRNNCNAIIETATNTIVATCQTTSIPSTVTAIGTEAFSIRNDLTTMVIPSNITAIGNGAFSHCQNLVSISIPNTVTSIGAETFGYCSNLLSVSIPNSVTSLGTGGLFMNCSNLVSVSLPTGISGIGFSAFENCSHLASIIIPETVTIISGYAFENCSSLHCITIPQNVTTLGPRCFYHCSHLDTIYMKPFIAPTKEIDSFDGTSALFIIPCGSYNAYGNYWNEYLPRIEMNTLSLTLEVNEPLRGSAAIIQQNGYDIPCDSSAIIEAFPTMHNQFSHWSNGHTANPDTLHLTEDCTIEAFFIPEQFTVTAVNANPTLGSISIYGHTGLSATYNYLDTAILIATSNDHHHFTGWTLSSGERISNTTLYLPVTANYTVTAHFAIDTHVVNVSSNDISRGMVNSSGTMFAYGQPCTVSAMPYTGYVFSGWNNGITANPYTFAVMSDMELVAIFTEENENTFMVTVQSGNPNQGTVTGSGTYTNGQVVTIAAVPYSGYLFDHWQDNNTQNPRTITVTGNATYTAYFVAIQSIDDVIADIINIYTLGGQIVVETKLNDEIYIYDIVGRKVDGGRKTRFDVPASGVYLVKIGTSPTQKVVVVK